MCGGGDPLTEKDNAQIQKYKDELAQTSDEQKTGPIKARSITDCLCCLVFIAGIVGFCGASAYGWQEGNPSLLLLGWDSDGNGCGYSDATKDFDKLYWPEPPSIDLLEVIKSLDIGKALEMLNFGVCVSTCPSSDKSTTVACKMTSYIANNQISQTSGGDYDGCVYQVDSDWLEGFGVDIGEYTKDIATAAGVDRYPYRYDSKELYGFCVPDFSTENVSALSDSAIKTFKKLFQDTVLEDKVTQYIADIAYSWQVILISTLTSVLLGYLYLILAQYIAGLIIWLSIGVILVSLLGGGYYVYQSHDQYEPESDYYDWVKYVAYGIWGVAALYALCICCCFNAIRLGIAVYKTTANYVASNLRIFLLPLVAYFFAACWLAVWIVSAVYVFSIGTPEPREGYPFITEMKWEDNTRYIVLYQFFMLFWVNAFIMGVCQFIIAASACIWYFEVNSDTQAKGCVGTGAWWAFRYHLGSIAFGAGLIALCQMIRLIFEYYRKKIQAANKNAFVKFMLCYTGYLLWALEKCIKFITKNAYIQVALTNTYFLKAAWRAFSLILSNVARFGWLHTIGSILNWFGVCAVAAVNTFLAYVCLTQIQYYKDTIISPIAPTVLIMCITFLIVKQFLSIFSYSLDAILQSFLLDEALGYAGTARPDSMSIFKSGLEKYAKPPKQAADPAPAK